MFTMKVSKTILIFIFAILCANVARAQAHVCDTAPVSGITVISSKPLTVGICFPMKDTDGVATVPTGARVTSDGTNVFNGPLPAPIGAPSAMGFNYYEVVISSIGKGNHNIVVYISNADGESAGSVPPFAFTLKGVPPAAPTAQTVKK